MEANGVDVERGSMVIMNRIPIILGFVEASRAKLSETCSFVLVERKLLKEIKPPLVSCNLSKFDFKKPCPR